jgi:hypothetical protein
MLRIQYTIILIVVFAIMSMFFMGPESFYGMSPGTLDQLSSTSVHPQRLNSTHGMYLLF